jgi:hypothetical protein
MPTDIQAGWAVICPSGRFISLATWPLTRTCPPGVGIDLDVGWALGAEQPEVGAGRAGDPCGNDSQPSLLHDSFPFDS